MQERQQAEARAAQEEALRQLRKQQQASLAKMKLPTTANWAAEDSGMRNRQESGELTLAEIQVRRTDKEAANSLWQKFR